MSGEFDPGPSPEEEGGSAHNSLCDCPSCALSFVQPIGWEQQPDRDRWKVYLRCPNCEWTGNGVYGQKTIDDFDEQLDNGTSILVRDLKRLTRANMEGEIERFEEALAVDAILPEDFNPLPSFSRWDPRS